MSDLPNTSATAPPPAPPGGGIDRSSTVTVLNKSSYDLTLQGSGAPHGSWDPKHPPVANIPANSKSEIMVLKDNFGFNGSQGWLNYLVGATQTSVRMDFECPLVGSSSASSTKIPDTAQEVNLIPPQFDPTGPLDVTFTIVPGGSG